MSSTEFPVERSHCNDCGRETKHFVVATRKQPGSELYQDNPYDEGVEISWCATYKLLECCGCETVSVQRTYWFSEWNPGDLKVEYFPPRVSRHVPSWVEQLPEDMRSLLQEIYAALQADSRRLALMGARAVVDIVIQQKIGDVGGFAQKLARLEQDGILSSRNRQVLEAALDAGNAAAHRGYLATPEEVNHVMDIVENLLHTDLLEAAAENLRRSTPQRPSKRRSGEKTDTA